MFLKIEVPDCWHNSMSVVEVDVPRFLDLWKNEGFTKPGTLASGNPETWRRDRKYGNMAQHFEHGIANPVPLARVVAGTRERCMPVYRRKWGLFKIVVGAERVRRPYVAIDSGITRTIFMLSHGVRYFPVLINTTEAQFLHEHAGVLESRPLTLGELLEIPMPVSGEYDL